MIVPRVKLLHGPSLFPSLPPLLPVVVGVVAAVALLCLAPGTLLRRLHLALVSAPSALLLGTRRRGGGCVGGRGAPRLWLLGLPPAAVPTLGLVSSVPALLL